MAPRSKATAAKRVAKSSAKGGAEPSRASIKMERLITKASAAIGNVHAHFKSHGASSPAPKRGRPRKNP